MSCVCSIERLHDFIVQSFFCKMINKWTDKLVITVCGRLQLLFFPGSNNLAIITYPLTGQKSQTTVTLFLCFAWLMTWTVDFYTKLWRSVNHINQLILSALIACKKMSPKESEKNILDMLQPLCVPEKQHARGFSQKHTNKLSIKCT